jgi:hypothetical protein
LSEPNHEKLSAMTTQPQDRDCDYSDTALAHQRRGPWVDYVREQRIRRHGCKKNQTQTDFEIFRELVDIWKTDTWHRSPISRRISHPAYLKIIGLGPKAIPWIIHELRSDHDYWFAALEAITREPSPETTSMSELRDAWLEWGKRHGY